MKSKIKSDFNILRSKIEIEKFLKNTLNKKVHLIQIAKSSKEAKNKISIHYSGILKLNPFSNKKINIEYEVINKDDDVIMFNSNNIKQIHYNKIKTIVLK